MGNIQIERLVYLGILASVLIFWAFVQGRESLGTKVKQMAAWAFIFLGVIAAFGLWEDVRSTVMPDQAVIGEDGRIELPRAPDGHYYATLELNGVPTRFVVDTGATSVVLQKADALRAGLTEEDLIYLAEARTANGIVRTAPVVLDTVAIGPFLDRDVRAYVNEGAMPGSLLGMDYLDRFARIEISGDRLILER